MADVRLSRRMVLLVPASDNAAVLGCGTDLGAIDCTLEVGESTIEAVARLLPTLGLAGPILDCVVDQTADADLGTSPRSALVELGSPSADWSLPPGWAWLPWNELDTKPVPGLAVKTATRIAELKGEKSIPPERSAWTQPGWYEGARAWIEQSLESAGRPLPDSVVQVRHCGISALLRSDAADDRTWFKASFPPFHAEASISATLAEVAPGATCGVVAVDERRGWILLDDFDGTTGATDPETTRRAVDHLVRLQSNMVQHHDALLASGCLRRTLNGLVDEFAAALASEIAVSRLALSAERVTNMLAAVADAATRIEAVGFPETLVHGDFHPGNVATTQGGMVLFDWSDGAIANPVIEVATWAWWFDGDEQKENELWSLFCAAWQREFGIDATTIPRRDVDVVAGAFHLVSYVRLLTGLEPSDQNTYIEGVDQFFNVLVNGMDEASDGV